MPQAATATTPTDATVALDRFLRGVERRALRMAELGLPQREDALDVVQDAMLAFVRNYRDKPEADWPPLFWRVLDTRLADRHRRNAVRSRWFAWLAPRPGDDEDDDPLAAIPDPHQPGPFLHLADGEAMACLDAALRALPHRQRQAFLLRVWEDFDVARSAAVMGVSEGSVKTHLFRALRNLRARLEAHR